MQISASTEGRTETVWRANATESETRVLRLRPTGGTTDEELDAEAFLFDIAKLVPAGTILRLTVETVDPLA